MKKIILGLCLIACPSFAQVNVQGTSIQIGGSAGGGSMTWPATGGIPNYSGISTWGTSYNAGNPIPYNFLNLNLTTNSTAGAATYTGGTFNIPTYLGYSGSFTAGHCLQIAATSPLTASDTGGPCVSAGVTSFNTRTGAVTLGAADVNAVGGITNNTSGTAANLSGTPALPNGTTATTQTVGDNSTKLATTAFVLANAGGAVFPSTPGVVCNTSSTASANCTGEDFAKAAGIGSATSILMSTTNPTSPGIQNVFLGPGVAPNNTGATGNGDSNIVIGYNAGASMTTARDMVLIGPDAGHDYTGNGAGADDGIYILIGAEAGYHLTAASTFGIAIGEDSLTTATSSASDVYMGRHAGDNLTTSSNTVAIGEHALGNNASTSESNVFVGSFAGASSTGGDKSNNVGVGYQVLSSMGAAHDNTAVGYQAGIALTTGTSNILMGSNAGGTVTTGSSNVIIAQQTLGCCPPVTGNSNVVVGTSLSQLTSGTNNTTVGVANLGGVSTGSYNTAVGDGAGRSGGNTTDTTLIGGGAGLNNTANGVTYVGRSAGIDATGARNTSVGNQSLNQVTTGTDNTALGDSACNLLTAAESGDICIGSDAQVAAGVSNAIQIGPGTNAVGGTTQMGNHVVIQPISGTNGIVSFGASYGATAIELYNDGASHYGWGLNAFEMQFYIPSSGTNHFSWNDGNAFSPSGTDELMRLCASGSLDIGNTNCGSGKLLEVGASEQFNVDTSGNAHAPNLGHSIGWSFGDAATGVTLTTAEVGYVTVPFSCKLTGWHIMADAGTVTIKTARVATGGTALPTLASNSISTTGVSLATGTLINSTTLTDFTSTTISAGDTLGFFITAVSTAKQITFSLDCQ